jgi:hypothetical protein
MKHLQKKSNLNRRKRRLEKVRERVNRHLQKEKQLRLKSLTLILRTLHGLQLMVGLKICHSYSYKAALIVRQFIMR